MPTFRSLAELVDGTHADRPSPQCAYLVKGESPCRSWMSQKTSNEARSFVAKHLDLLTGSSGECTDGSPHSEFFQHLAIMQLCNNHKKHGSQAIAQWLNEFTGKRDSLFAKLEQYYNLGIDDTHTGKSGYDADEIGLSGNKSNSDKGRSDNEENASDGGEGVSTLSSQSSLPTGIGVRRHTVTITKHEVEKNVTCLLESAIETKSKTAGWIYAICPENLPGMVKVGFTLDPPHLQRFPDHENCHSEFEVLMTKLVPYPYRVEQLVLTEFSNKHYELENGCQNRNCRGTCHKELLKIDRNILLKSMRKWIKFVESFPYRKDGQLTKEARGKSPPLPALKTYFGYDKQTLSRTSKGATPKKKSGSEDSHITPPPNFGFTAPTSTEKSLRFNEFKLNQDGLCAAVEDFQLTPSRQTADSIEKRFSMPGSFC